MHERNLMVRQGHRDYSLKSKPNSGNPKIPFILLKGTWLEECGFVIGLPIFVQVTKHQLIITSRM
ncbi:MAG: type I toxin-antitoxin system SymE family toxin [Candidatus Thiodiazotropha sp. (ex Epidulcina cf. delphinae)]|nr:type I toxin-antitoxin system SymE family toxin [Candidatus Thiodiazotropha sp. (ex Epidulcina cf. delphinae)]